MWRRVGRDSLILVGSAFSLVFLQFAYRYIAVRELSVPDYGRVGLLLGIFNGATVLGTYGIPATTSRLAARTHGRVRDRHVLRAAAVSMSGPSAAAMLIMGASTYVVTRSATDAVVAVVGVPPLIWSGLYAGFIRGKGMIWASATIQPANLIFQVLALLAVTATRANVGVGWVLACFYVGNAGAYACARVALEVALRRSSPVEDEPDPDATVGRILGFSAWLALANLAVLLLAVLPRVSLAHFSYRQVAYFDLALLIYTIPQRLRSSFLVALLPIAAVERKRGSKFTVPSNQDLAFVTALFVVFDVILWMTHALRLLFTHIGMGGYAGAEPLLLIILLAAPAELFYGLDSGLLQAFGQSRRIGLIATAILACSVAAAPATAVLGPKYLAGVLVVDYWALHLVSRRLLAENGVLEQAMLLPALRSRLLAFGKPVVEPGGP